MPEDITQHRVGDRVRVVQQAPHGSGVWTTSVEGVIVALGQAKTGSWFAHARDDKLWLDRLELRTDEGERVVVNLDQYSRVETLQRADDASGEAA